MVSDGLPRLNELLPPPRRAVCAPPWQDARQQIGTAFPRDYRQFIDCYGGGFIIEPATSFDWIIGGICRLPRRAGWPGGFGDVLHHQRTQLRPLFEGTDARHWGSECPYIAYPEPGGLLQWGQHVIGDMFFWDTADPDPDRWTVVMFARGPAETIRYDGGMVDFMIDVLSGEHLASRWLGDPAPQWIMTEDWENPYIDPPADIPR